MAPGTELSLGELVRDSPRIHRSTVKAHSDDGGGDSAIREGAEVADASEPAGCEDRKLGHIRDVFHERKIRTAHRFLPMDGRHQYTCQG